MLELDATEIFSAINLNEPKKLIGIKLFDEINSTNDYLKKNNLAGQQPFQVVIAEHQTAGRGQYGKKWVSEKNKGLWMSLAFNIKKEPRLTQLSLLVGHIVAKKLLALGVKNIGLKWPNDLIIEGQKLGGILIDSVAYKRDYLKVIIGLGINISLPSKTNEVFSGDDLKPIALGTMMNKVPALNFLAAQCIESMYHAIEEFQQKNFSILSKEWAEFDLLYGQQVIVKTLNEKLEGLAQGISSEGELLVLNTEGLHHVASGSVRKLNNKAITC